MKRNSKTRLGYLCLTTFILSSPLARCQQYDIVFPSLSAHTTMNNPESTCQKATDIYKRLLLENRDDLALNVYVAMCYYKLDYYDVSLEILAVYLQAFPDSAVAMNLKVRARERERDAKAVDVVPTSALLLCGAQNENPARRDYQHTIVARL